MQKAPSASYLVHKEALVAKFGPEVFETFAGNVKQTLQMLHNVPPPLPQPDYGHPATKSPAPQPAPPRRPQTPAEYRKVLLAKYKQAATALDPVKMREAQRYCMLVFKEVGKLREDGLTMASMPPPPKLHEEEMDPAREKSFNKLKSTIDKQILAFKEMKGTLKDGDPQIKACDAELEVLEASKNTLMGALITNGALPSCTVKVKEFLIERSFPQISSEALKIEVVSCSDIPLPKDTKPKDLDILVAYSMTYPEVRVS